MRVAVIIAARNLAPLLGDAIRSVLAQRQAEADLVVVDDGSTDGTPEVIRGFASPRLQTVTTPGLGVSAARNLGARHPRAQATDALLFLDGDDWLSPDALVRLTAALRRDGQAAASHGAFAFVQEAATPAAPGAMDRRRPAGTTLPQLVRGNRFANGGHVLIRASAWAGAGPFREDIAFAEDWEFWPRLRVQGAFLAVPGAPTLFVRRRAGSLMHGSATDPDAYRPALSAMAADGRLRTALGPERLERLNRRACQEVLWTIGREQLRRGAARSALPLLRQGFFGQWRPQRLSVLLQAAWQARSG
jgi:GT2 family glycosyltransferase